MRPWDCPGIADTCLQHSQIVLRVLRWTWTWTIPDANLFPTWFSSVGSCSGVTRQARSLARSLARGNNKILSGESALCGVWTRHSGMLGLAARRQALWQSAMTKFRERGSAPKGCRHSTIFVDPQWKLCLSSAHLCSGSLMVRQSAPKSVS